MPYRSSYRPDACSRKSRLAARILLRGETGRLQPRDIRVARVLAADPAVTDRLIDQALASLRAPFSYRELAG